MIEKRKKNKNEARLNLVLPTDLKDDLEMCAESKGINVSALIRMCLIEYLKKEKSNGK